MPKIQLFTIKATVKGVEVNLDYTSKKPLEDSDSLKSEQFPDTDIRKKAQEIAEFNNAEKTLIKSFGDGEYTIDLKVIV